MFTLVIHESGQDNAVVTLTPDVPVEIYDGSVWRFLEGGQLSGPLAAGSVSLSVPTDTETRPPTHWTGRLALGAEYRGPTPSTLDGLTLTLDDLLTSHGWEPL